MHNAARIDQLTAHRKALIDYLIVKTAEFDWHGVSDAANDLREVELELRLWRGLPEVVALQNGKFMAEAARSYESVTTALQTSAMAAMDVAADTAKPPTQTVTIPPMDFHEPMQARTPDQAMHELLSDYSFQQYIAKRFGPSPNGDDYSWATECVLKTCNSETDLENLVADWKKQ